MNYNKAELCKDCKQPVEKRLPTKFHLDKIVKHFNAAVYQIEDLMVMYSKAGRKDIAKKLRRDADKVKEVYYNLKIRAERIGMR